MKPAILFWFYKDAKVCKNRIELLRKHNPALSIFGLYGGPKVEVKFFSHELQKYLDDLYSFPFSWTKEEKWYHGDLMLLHWYQKRGRRLPWSRIAVVQWDTLVFDSIDRMFQGMKENEIFISGLRTLTPVVEARFCWTKPRSYKKGARKDYRSFLASVRKQFGFLGVPLCCQFIFSIFPRNFFELYRTVKNPHVGFLEYKIPTLAKIFGIPFFRKNIGVRWFERHNRFPLNAYPIEISREYIRQELKERDGWRMFHPYYSAWK